MSLMFKKYLIVHLTARTMQNRSLKCLKVARNPCHTKSQLFLEQKIQLKW